MTAERIVVLSGPTASGKSALALALAREFPVEIVNADSLQVYRHFDIGTAKPTVTERGEVPHHLIDVADPDEPYDAGRYVREAERAIGEIRARGKVPMLVGGTGMYIRALLRGLDPLPSDPRVREELSRRWETEGGATLHAELARIDPETSANVHPSDRLRVLRALEIAAVAGIPPAGRVRPGAPRGRGTGACSLPFGRTGRRCTAGSMPGRRRCSGEDWRRRSVDCSPAGSTAPSSR